MRYYLQAAHSPSPALQVVAYGSCIDGTTCTSSTTCGASVNTTKVMPMEAWASPLFSTAELVVQPGSHSYLVRMNNYLGRSAWLVIHLVVQKAVQETPPLQKHAHLEAP